MAVLFEPTAGNSVDFLSAWRAKPSLFHYWKGARMRISLLKHVIVVVAVTVLSGCASQMQPSASTNQQSVVGSLRIHPTSQLVSPANKTIPWGIGLQANPREYDGASEWSESICQSHGSRRCPPYAHGKRTDTYTASQTLNDPSFATVSLNESGTSKLGYQVFSQSETATGYLPSNDVAFALNSSYFYWTDELTPTSTTLRSLAIVRFGEAADLALLQLAIS